MWSECECLHDFGAGARSVSSRLFRFMRHDPATIERQKGQRLTGQSSGRAASFLCSAEYAGDMMGCHGM